MSLNWTQLVAKGRAKDIGMPWNEEELHARYTLNIPAEFVREGILTLEAYEKATKPKDRAALETEAKAEGLSFADETPDTVLAAHVDKAKGRKKK